MTNIRAANVQEHLLVMVISGDERLTTTFRKPRAKICEFPVNQRNRDENGKISRKTENGND